MGAGVLPAQQTRPVTPIAFKRDTSGLEREQTHKFRQSRWTERVARH